MSEQSYIPCPSCKNEITPDSDFCPHCGIIFDDASELAYCEVHMGVHEGGVCIICRKLLCRECAVNVSSRLFCMDHADLEVQQDYVNVFESSDPSEVTLVFSILEQAGIQALSQNVPRAIPNPLLVDDNFFRTSLGQLAKIFVPIPLYAPACKVLEEWEEGNKDFGADNY